MDELRDTQYNLPIGTDCISRKQAIEAVQNRHMMLSKEKVLLINDLEKLPSAQLATDTNVGTKLGTNLAEVGTDCISRQQAIDDIWTVSPLARLDRKWVDRWLRQLPSAQPEIIRCRECKFASGDSRICMKFDHSPIGELDFCSFAERREVNNESD